MRSAVVAASLVSAVAASWGPGAPAHGPPGGSWGSGPQSDSWTTEVVTAFTTFCPAATQITYGGQTYTATEATTLTITNCPGGCTISHPTTWATSSPVATSPVAYTTPAAPTTWAETSTPVASSPVASSPVASSPVAYTTPVAPTTWATSAVTSPIAPTPYPVGNATTWSTAAPVASTASAYPSSPVPATGAASQLSAGAAAVLAVFGLVAAL